MKSLLGTLRIGIQNVEHFKKLAQKLSLCDTGHEKALQANGIRNVSLGAIRKSVFLLRGCKVYIVEAYVVGGKVRIAAVSILISCDICYP